MRKFLAAGIAATALLNGAAVAADLRAPAYPAYKAAPQAPAPFSWTGFYFGTHTGAAVGVTTTRNTAPYGGFDAGTPVSYDLNTVAIFSGGQAGYNWQFGNIVLGAEIEGGYLGIRASQYPGPNDYLESKYTWYGTFTGRAGFAYERLLTYVKGGAAVAKIRNTASDYTGSVITTTDYTDSNTTRWGWTVGSGFEYAILPNWTVKSEYLYMDFGTRNSTNLDGDVFQHHNRVQTWKVGLNYRWGGSVLPGY